MPSFRARLVMALIRVSGLKYLGRNPANLPGAARLDQSRGTARPSRALRREFLVSSTTADGHETFTVAPREGASRHHILYLHGGAYVFEMIGLHWRTIAALIRRTGATVTVPIYPLAPRHSWRDAFAMLRPLHAELAARHGAANITIAGDSAGGGMALALAQLLREVGDPLPGRLLLFSPWLDVATDDPGVRAIEPRDPLLAIPAAQTAGRWWADELPLDDPRVSPIHGALSGLPPIAVFTGTRDMLNADARRLRDKAAGEGADLRFHEYDGMFHVWVCTPIPEARQALDEAAAFIADPPAGEAARPPSALH